MNDKINASNVILINPTSEPAGPTENYTQLWGSTTDWRDGPHLLSALVHWLHGRALELDAAGSTYNLQCPMPQVRPDVILLPFNEIIPERYRERFQERLAMAVDRFYQTCKLRCNTYLNNADSNLNRTMFQAMLDNHNNTRRTARLPTFQMMVAEALGFHGGHLPQPATVIVPETPREQ